MVFTSVDALLRSELGAGSLLSFRAQAMNLEYQASQRALDSSEGVNDSFGCSE